MISTAALFCRYCGNYKSVRGIPFRDKAALAQHEQRWCTMNPNAKCRPKP